LVLHPSVEVMLINVISRKIYFFIFIDFIVRLY